MARDVLRRAVFPPNTDPRHACDRMILLNQKLSLTSTPPEEEALTPSDDAVRQALLRMGGGANGASPRRGGEQASPGPATPESRRRRFSQNENVPVEYVSRDRQGGQGARHEPGEGADPSASLGRALERERHLREAAERTLAEVRAALQVAQTRLAHLEIEVEEARAQRVAPPPPVATPEPVPEPEPPRPTRGRGRPRMARVAAEPEDEPEPVKWWIRD